MRKLWAVVGIVVFLPACQESPKENAKVAISSPTPPQFKATTPTVPNEEKSTAPVVRLDIEEPMMPLRGTIKAYEIRDVSQFSPGLLADGFLGDLVLENDLVRFVVRRPDPSLPEMPPAGAIIDVANQKSHADYFNYCEPIPDVETTTTKIKIERVASFLVDKQTTSRLVLTGRLIETLAPPPSENESQTSPPVTKNLPVRVVMTYELAKDTPYLIVKTTFTNESTGPISLSPGDFIDWGEAQSFVEGLGVGVGVVTKSNWVGATIDNFSMGVCLPGPKPVTNYASGRYTVVQALETEARKPLALPTHTPSPTPSLTKTVQSFAPGGFTPIGVANQPEQPRATPTLAPPRTETTYAPQAKPTMAPIRPPRAETIYGPHANVGDATRRSQATILPAQQASDLHGESLGGGGGKNEETTGVTGPLKGPSAESKLARTDRVVLAPRKSYEYTRYYVVGDRNLSRVSEQVYRLKNIPLGVVAGLVVEEGTNRPIAQAEVRVSGGAAWNGKGAPYAFTKTLTRADGTFVVRLPYGNYVLTAAKVGRQLVISPQKVSLYRKSAEQYVGIILSKEARIEVAVSDPDAPTSAPLPCRLTLVAKPGTEPIDWGYGSGSVAAVRNVAYMPYGGATLPVTPGYYRLLISRGPEYDALEQDLVVTKGSTQKIIVTLPRAFRTPGMVSADVGVMTTASAIALTTPEDLAVMAACEGVSVLVSGDFEKATDLTQAIKSLQLQKYVKAIPGMRFLVSGRGATANVLVYPVTAETEAKLRDFRAKSKNVAPDVFLADLRRQFSDLVIQIDQPLHPLAGYLARIPFNERFKRYEDSDVPPPDFHALQVLNGKLVNEFQDVMDRYFDLAVKRTRWPEASPALTPLGSSMCRLPYGTEVGYPRVYAITIHDTLDTFSSTDLAQSIMNQRVIVTNSLMPKLLGYSPAARTYAAQPGDVVDTGTTGALPMKINIMAASWVSLSNFDLTWNGKLVRRIQVMPVKRVLRYPVRQQADADMQYVYVDGDGFSNLICFSNRKSLSPIVPASLPDFGGDVWPLAWTGPIFVDQNRDGKIRIESQQDQKTKP
jgi:hypothetical protein